jgi:hypothetical protein
LRATVACGQQYPLTGQQLGLHGGEKRRENLLGLEHSSIPELAAGLIAARGPENFYRVIAHLRNVALGRGIAPHLNVHRRRDQKRAVAREAEGGQEVAAKPCASLAMKSAEPGATTIASA